MKRSPINPMSAKKKQQILEEIEARKALAQRCGGVFIVTKWDKEGRDWGGFCLGGRCEICGNYPHQSPPDFELHPHEKVFRSRLGKMTLENSKMVCNTCGMKEHNLRPVESKPMWSKNED